jgi:hypothetical protein
MSRLRTVGRGAVAALLVSGVVAVPNAAAADVVLPFTNYEVGGTLSLAKLRQSIALPAGSTFNGAANLTTSQLSGNVFIPQFTSTIKVLGIPTQVTTQLAQAEPVNGSVTLNPDFSVAVHARTSAILKIRTLGVGPFRIPTTCRTADPVVLRLDYEGPLTGTLTFDGTTTIPRLTGCGVLGPALGLLLSGPGNAYHLTLSPPAA